MLESQECKENLRTRESREKKNFIAVQPFILTCRHLPCSVLDVENFCVAIPTTAR